MATIQHRSKNSWRAEVCVGGIRKSATRDTYDEAAEWARHIEADLERGLIPVVSKNVTLASLIKKFIENCVVGKRRTTGTERVETGVLSRIAKEQFAEKPLSRLSSVDFSDYRNRRLKQCKPATVRNELNMVSSVFESARELGVITPNVCDSKSVKRPKVKNDRDRILSPDEWFRLKQKLAECTNSFILPAAIFSYETGLRISELLELKWKDTDVVKATIRVDKVRDRQTQKTVARTKNDGTRIVPLSPIALAVLSELNKVNGRIFPLSHDVIENAFPRARKRAALDDFRWHDLRHCAITKMARHIPNPLDLMAVSGHQTLSQVQRYYKALEAEKLARLLAHPDE